MRMAGQMTTMRKLPLVAVIAVLLGSGQAHALDLVEAWHAAQQTDPTLSAAKAGAEAGAKKNDQARALRMPQVMLTAGTGITNTYNKISNAQFSAPGMGAASGANFTTQDDHGVSLNLNVRAEQSLYDVEKSTHVRQLGKQAQLAEVKLGAEEQQLMLRVSQAYLDVLLTEDQLTAIQAHRQAVTEALNIATERFKEGDVAIIDTNEAQARHDAIASQELEINSHLQLARALLADLTGDVDSRLAHLPEQVNFSGFNPGTMSQWVTLAQTQSPDFLMQQIQQGIAQDEIDKHRAVNAPVLNLVAQAGMEDLRGIGGGMESGLTNHNVSVGLQLNIPLFTGGMRDAKLGEATALAEQARYEAEAMRLKAGQAARMAWQGVTVGQAKVQALEQALFSAQVRLDATRLGSEVGDRTALDVLNAEQEYFNAKQALSQARYQWMLAYLGLYASAGELNEKTLSEVNALLSTRPE
jgi:outer membrane protein